MIEDPDDPALYTREFGSRPLQAFGVGLVFAVLFGSMGIAFADLAIVFMVLTAICLTGGILGYLRATKRVELMAGRVVKTSAIGTREYETSSLVLEQRGENVFVLKPRDSRTVVSVIQDVDPDHVRAVFATAGVERIVT
jgi:hypothetical protein